jgi:hypothetical protein
MEKKRYQYLWDAFDLAVKEKAANPMSSRLLGVEVLVREQHDALAGYGTALDAVLRRTQEQSSQTGLPAAFVAAATGYNRDEHREVAERIAELALLLGEIDKARRS